MENFVSGFVCLIGRANVGKSTLLNAFAGAKLAAVSPKPQTTRRNALACLTRDDCQIAFFDTPGIFSPKNALDEHLEKNVKSAAYDADVCLFITDVSKNGPERDAGAFARFSKLSVPRVLAVNKADTLKGNEVLPIIARYGEAFNFSDIVPISAKYEKNLEELIRVLKKHLPAGEALFPADYTSDQTERAVAAEIIREKALFLLSDEVPHGLAVVITGFKLRKNPALFDINAEIFCEKQTHKGIIIGKNGETLKKIGSAARAEMEKTLGAKVNLALWVKVRQKWRGNETLIKQFGLKSGS